MGYDYIHKEASRLVRKYGTRDPFNIARQMGIHVIYDYDFTTLKGMYMVIQRSRFIIINGNLNDHDTRTVCAHELGHDRLHRDMARRGAFQEFMLYNMRSRHEYEANIFASELLIDTDELLDLADYDYDIFQIAGELGEDINLVLIKVDEMRMQGYNVRVPYRPDSGFLGEN